MIDLFTRRIDIASCPWTKQRHLGKCSNGKLRTGTLVNDVTLRSTVNFTSTLGSVNNIGHFRGCLRTGGSQKAPLPLPKICYRYHTMMKLGTVIPYLKKIKKIYESCDPALEFCSLSAFFHRKSANFVISRNTDIYCILIHNF